MTDLQFDLLSSLPLSQSSSPSHCHDAGMHIVGSSTQWNWPSSQWVASAVIHKISVTVMPLSKSTSPSHCQDTGMHAHRRVIHTVELILSSQWVVSCNTQNNSYCNAIITVQFSVTLSHDARMHIVGTSTQWNCPNLRSQSRQLKYTNISYCNTTVEFPVTLPLS